MSWDEPARNEPQPPQNSGNQPLFQPLPPPQSPPQPQPLGGWAGPTDAPDQTRAFGPTDQPGPFGGPEQTAAYGTPTAQQPYDQTPYGQTPYGANPMVTPYGAFGTPPPVPPKKKRGGLAVGALVVVVAAAVGVYVLLGHSNSTTKGQNTAATAAATTAAGGTSATTAPAGGTPSAAATGSAGGSTMALPASAGGLVQVDNSLADQAKAGAASGISSSGLLSHPLIGVYGLTDSKPELVLVDQPLASMSAEMQGLFGSMAPSEFMQTMVTGSGLQSATTETSTDPNTALSCGTAAGGSTVQCVWLDKASFGIVSFTQPVSTSDAAKYSDALRAAAEGS